MRSLGPRAWWVYEELQARILTGRYPAGEQLPPQDQLSREFGVALLTIRQAMARLQEEGLLTSMQGRGTFVGQLAHEDGSKRDPDLIGASPIPIIVLDLEGRVQARSRAAEILTGYAPDEVLGKRPPALPPEGGQQFDEIVARLAAGESVSNVSIHGRHKDGTRKHFLLFAEPLRDAGGGVTGSVAALLDVTEHARAARNLVESEERFRAIFQGSTIGINVADDAGHFTDANPAFCTMLGYTREEIVGMTVEDITHPDDIRADLDQLQGVASGELAGYELEKRYVRKDGRVIWVRLRVSPLRRDDGSVRLNFGMVQDVSEQREFEARIEHQMVHDTLTDLPNRVLLHARLHEALREGARSGRATALLVLDLNGFKEINSSLGDEAGDLLLQQAGGRFLGVIREGDTVARLGDDEFAVLVPGAGQLTAQDLADRFHTELAAPFDLGEQAVYVTASIGIAVAPEHGDHPALLLRRADVAMGLAKQRGHGTAVYSSERDVTSPGRLELASDLREAISRRELMLYYQPKVDAGTGALVGVEALARWFHPRRGAVPPDEFIPVAEQTGLIRPLTYLVLEMAAEQRRRWADRGLDIPIAVNLSARNLTDPTLVEKVERLFRRWNLQRGWLGIEITETAVMTDSAHARLILALLHAMGLTVSIDDFGVGHSSLGYLKSLPVDEIKVDRSFVSGIASDPDDAFIVRSVAELGHHLGLSVSAEGAETHEDLDVLRTLRCDVVQGYFFSPPLPAEALERWVESREYAA